MIHPTSREPRKEMELLLPFSAQPESETPADLAQTPDIIPSQMQPPGSVSETPVETTDATRPNWLKRNAFKISGALFLGGVALGVATNPMDKLEHEVAQVAPWAVSGLVAGEVAWEGGLGLMAIGAGKSIGNPFTLRSRWDEISTSIIESKTFKIGLATNTVAALGMAGIVGAAASQLPAETWPGAAGLVAADMASTLAIRTPLYRALAKSRAQHSEESAEVEKSSKVKVRHATFDDIDRLADIDLQLFEKAYGEELPPKEEIVDMLTQRLANNPGWMFVAEMNGQVEGFVTAFRTNKPADQFESWEESTHNGTLEGKVDPNGKYVYIANMTIQHEAVKQGAKEMLLANLFANGIRDGIEYGYFESRMPYFKRWLEKQPRKPGYIEKSLEESAEEYFALTFTRKTEDMTQVETVPYDPQLRMYTELGFKMDRMVPNAFKDDASMNYGVVFTAPVPPSDRLKQIKPVRTIMGAALRLAAKNPKVLRKVF